MVQNKIHNISKINEELVVKGELAQYDQRKKDGC